MKKPPADTPPKQESFTLMMTLENKEHLTLKLSRNDALMIVNSLSAVLKGDKPDLQVNLKPPRS